MLVCNWWASEEVARLSKMKNPAWCGRGAINRSSSLILEYIDSVDQLSFFFVDIPRCRRLQTHSPLFPCISTDPDEQMVLLFVQHAVQTLQEFGGLRTNSWRHDGTSTRARSSLWIYVDVSKPTRLSMHLAANLSSAHFIYANSLLLSPGPLWLSPITSARLYGLEV